MCFWIWFFDWDLDLIIEIIGTLYHMCFLDFWRGVVFGLRHRKHANMIYFATCPDGTRTAICGACNKELRFKQK